MDKVKLHAQERLDLDDTRALQSLVYDYVSEALGGLMGHAHGVLSVPKVVTTENSGAPYITVRPFAFVTTTPMETGSTGQPLSDSVPGGIAYKQFKSIVVNYDPEEETSQQIDIDYLRANFGVLVLGYGAQYLWARPISVNTDTATRRKWDVTSGAEVTFSDHTRESQRVEFVIQNGEPSYAEGESRWARVAQITGFTNGDNAGSTPQITWFSVFDDSMINEFLDVEDATASTDSLLASASSIPFDSNNRSYRSFGLPMVLGAVKRQLARITGASNWLFDMSGSATLLSLLGRVVALEARQVSPVQCIASCRIGANRSTATTEQIVTAGYIGSSYGIERSYSLVTAVPSPQNRFNIRISNDVLEQGWAVSHVSVTQDIVFKQTGDHRDYNRVTFLVHPNAYTSDSSDTSTMRLYDNTATNRGVIVEMLPQEVLPENHQHTENEIHPPTGADGGESTTIFDSFSPDSSEDPYDVIFTVAVFAVASDLADN